MREYQRGKCKNTGKSAHQHCCGMEDILERLQLPPSNAAHGDDGSGSWSKGMKFVLNGWKLRKINRLHYLVVIAAFSIFLLCPAHCIEPQAPRFIKQPSSSARMVNEGYTKIMQCQAFGSPPPEYRWLRDGQFVGESAGFTPDSLYRITNTSPSDAGQYQCIARNEIGAIFSEKLPLTVAYMSEFEPLSAAERSITVQRGHAALIRLPSIRSVPKPAVRWEAAGRTSLYDIKYAVGVDGSLVVLAVEPDDQTEYSAYVTNTQIGSESVAGPFTLRVVGGGDGDVAPQVVLPPTDLEVTQGHDAKLVCVINVSPLHDLKTEWYKDGVKVEQAMIAFTYEDPWQRTLSLLGVDQSHAGLYECRSRMRNDVHPPVSAQATVTVLEKPQVTPLPRQSPGDLGRVVSLPCTATGNPPASVIWYRNTVDLNSLNSEGRYTILSNNTLVIRNLKGTDAGMYQCTAASSVGEATTYTWLRVKSSQPVMVRPPTNVTVLDGQDARLTCQAEGAPPPNITWMFNGKMLEDVVLGGQLEIQEQGDLLISRVHSDHSGLYTCTRANEAGQVSASAFLSTRVRTQIVYPPADSRVILGHVARLQCGTAASEGVAPLVSWYHEGAPIQPSSRVRILENGSLQIAQARAADVGRYTCKVVSSGGNVSRSADLHVVELPYAPTNVRALKVASLYKTVRVTWTAGFDGNSPLLNFIIQSRRVPISSMVTGTDAELGESWITKLTNVSAAAREVTLVGLTAAAAYQFRVSAVNAVGEGATSVPSNTVLLPQEAPSGPPLGLVGSARSRSEIMIQWSPPQDLHRNGRLLGYMVRYRLHGYTNAPWNNYNISNEVQRNHLIRDLITWKDYDIEVAAYNQRGTGVFSRPITVKTREGVPEAPPTGVSVNAVNSTAVRVSWTPPDPQMINGINQGYKLQAWKGDPDLVLTLSAEVTATVAPSPLDPLAEQVALLSGLQKYAAYNITVLCFTSPGDGVRSRPVSVKTLQDVPGPVDGMHFENVTDRSVAVLWRPPRLSNGVLTGFTVRYSIVNSSHTAVERNVSSQVMRLTVDKLKPSTVYVFDVWAWTEIGAGEIRSATLQSGVEPVLPDAPRRLAVSNIQPFSVVLQFTPGFDGNSSIISWTVQAWTSRNQSWQDIFSLADPTASTITVTTLIPFTQYRLRLVANNVVGASKPSEPSQQFQTIQAPPAHGPQNVSVRALSPTSLRVGWIPLQQVEWHGVPRGYNITFRRLNADESAGALSTRLDTIAIEDHNANSYVIDDLEEYQWYEVIMQSFNDVGSSKLSQPVRERTREAVPEAGPADVLANATSSTTIVVTWSDISPSERNGIIEGYKVFYGYKDSDFKYKLIDGNQTRTTTLTQLKKFTKYRVQVLGRTRLGDGVLSAPPVVVRTHEDVPGAPSNVSFPDVSYSFARVIWEEPAEPNGVLLAFRVTYYLKGRPETSVTQQFEPQARTYKASNLQPERSYMFLVAARSRLGWGDVAQAAVFTTNNREHPQPPSAPQISQSQILSDRITFSWTPGPDGYAPLRYYTVQAQISGGGWQELALRIDPTLTAYTVTSLKPFTTYRFRIQATNDRGPSGWSLPSVLVKTHSAAPRESVSELRAIPITTTSVRVDWRPLSLESWSGDALTGGYRVIYRQLADFPSPLLAGQEQSLSDIQASSVVLESLTRGKNYEVVVVAFNSQGDSPPTSPVQVYVGEAFPTGEPRQVSAKAVSSTEIRLTWQPPPESEQNGDIQGYKVFYLSSNDSAELEQMDVVPGSHRSFSLLYLDMYTEYQLQMLAFNMAGDGPRSQPISARTLTGIPGPPGRLQFSDITMTSLKVSWDPPARPNGVIQGYLVMYETAVPNEDFSKQVKQKVSGTYLHVQNLEERVSYSFTVRALTIDYGAASRGNVTTGPQPGSPGSPKALLVTPAPDSVSLYWQNGASGLDPIRGYVIEAKLRDDDSWRLVERTVAGAQADFKLTFSSLLPSSQYLIRLMAYNEYGVSFPTASDQPVSTPSKLYLHYREPFYRSTWFMVTLAATLVIILIAVTAVLCVKSKSYKYKKKAEAMEETMSMEALAEGFSIEHRSSRRSTLKRNTLGRKSLAGSMAGAAAPPPRPAPASVAYNSDTESKYDERHGSLESSSTSEKPSDVSSTDSQVEDEDELYYESGQRSLVGHYSNMNDVCRLSWKRQRPIPPRHAAAAQQAVAMPAGGSAARAGASGVSASTVGAGSAPGGVLRNYASHTDSEQEGSAVMSLNGAEVVVNNRAGSRAPLTSGLNAFSSFV